MDNPNKVMGSACLHCFDDAFKKGDLDIAEEALEEYEKYKSTGETGTRLDADYEIKKAALEAAFDKIIDQLDKDLPGALIIE